MVHEENRAVISALIRHPDRLNERLRSRGGHGLFDALVAGAYDAVKDAKAGKQLTAAEFALEAERCAERNGTVIAGQRLARMILDAEASGAAALAAGRVAA